MLYCPIYEKQKNPYTVTNIVYQIIIRIVFSVFPFISESGNSYMYVHVSCYF